MIRDNILKPLPKRIHITFWAIYFAWVTAVNIYKYGGSHVGIIICTAPLMLGISYMNRAWLRQMLFRKFAIQRMGILLLCFLFTALAIFLALYRFPSELSRRVLREPKVFKAVDYGIDVFTFYCSFTLKGILILALEVIFNLGTGLFRHLGWLRTQSQESIKATLFRNWVIHFMGNLTQSFTRLVRNRPSKLTLIDLFLGLEAYAMQSLNFKESILGKLEDEVFYLRQFLRLYDENRISMQLEILDRNNSIIPMVLLSLCKNMIKHGDFTDSSFQSIIYVFSDTDRVLISSVNKIAPQSEWIYKAGGTGLEQMTKLLYLYYGESFTLITETENGVFQLTLEINF